MQLGEYQLDEVIYAAGETVVATASAADGRRVVLKYLDSNRPAPELAARWQHEYAVLRSIDSDWVIKASGLIQVGHSLVLVLEAYSAVNLAQLIARQALDLSERLTLAVQLVHAVDAVHQHRLIHGDISPKNVLVDVARLRLKLCDFGLSSRLDHEQKRDQDAFLRGTLEYMSPEQTGRTSLDVDYRSDFYSLGISLYELFSGRRPFQSGDPMTLLHAQIAQVPTPLHQLDPSIPEPLSALVQKLLAKFPDERYQSSFGLLHDLQHCEQQWQRFRRIEHFALAAADVPERFCMAQKLYGREAECAALLAAFERASCGRAELLLVGGYAGVGKSALVGELHRPVVARRGYFLRGKCDQYSRNQPYAALAQAFHQLVRQLAVEGVERRQYWRAALTRALGEHAAAVTAIVPSLELLIGTPPPLPALPAAENEQRFHFAFARFVKALAANNHPLLLFLDDLQWADVPTLRLLEHLVCDEDERCALIVGAYRDNEVDAEHPLLVTVQRIERDRAPVPRLDLRPLGIEHVGQWIADSLRATPVVVAPLAELCLAKTQGNPFFLGQFLHSLHASGEIRYQREAGAWQWDLQRIRQRGMTDNVVELMLQRLRELAPATQALLALAAHLGDSFNLRQLMAVGERDAQATAAVLWPALLAGLVLPLDEDYKFADSPALLEAARFRFLHDRVQQACNDLTAPAQRRALQLRCGRLLWAHSSEEELEQRLFVVLQALNEAVELIVDAEERARLLALNLRGGIRAKAASAYPAAVVLLRQARALLPPDAWQAQPEQTLSLYRELAEAEYLAGDFAAAEGRYPEGIAACAAVEGKVSLCLVQADQYHIQGRFADALPVLLHALDLLGCPFPASEEEAGALFVEEFAECERLLGERTEAALLAAEEMATPARLLEMRAYYGLAYAVYQLHRSNAYVLNACRMVRTTLRHGQCDLSSIAYVTYVTAMAAMKRPYPQCYRQGKLAMALAEQRDNRYFRLSVYQYFCAFYQHWGEALANGTPYLDQGVDMGQAGINPLAAGYCVLLRANNRFIQGAPLDLLQQECERGLKFLQQSHQVATEAMLRYGVLLPLLALRGQTLQPTSFDTDSIRSSEYFQGDYATPTIPLAFHIGAAARHAYLLDDAPLWRRCADNLAVVGKCLPDSPSLVETSFYAALGLLKPGFHDAGSLDANIAAATAHLENFRVWADGCPDNFRPKALLIAAELARVRGQERSAMDLYAQAIDAAAEADSPVCEGLANELYARFWSQQQQKQLASNFIREAYFHFRRWGAAVKCRQLEAQWPQIAFRMVEQRRGAVDRTSTYSDVSEQSGLLDLQSLLKASQLLSQEIQLDSLLEKLLGVLIENAGAERGAIVLVEDDELVVEALGGANPARRMECERIGRRLRDIHKDDQPLLPNAVIEYVQLTQSTLVLNNPLADERFSRSRYFSARQPKSVMCLPVVSQGKLVALVYLENTLLANAFTAKQQKTLELLSTQAAISLVNARLVEQLERKVAQRTEELRRMTMKDGLTGIANRRNFDERLSIEWRRSQRHGLPLSLLMLDIDHFKQYNDHYGHLEGDRCIRAVAQALERAAGRAGDLVARYGGEEFAILLPETDRAAAAQVAAACLQAVAALALPHAANPVGPQVSISIGSSTLLVAADADSESLIGQADRALYEAKRGGRNRYRPFEPVLVAAD